MAVWQDPYPAYNFKLEIRGVMHGHFTEVSGMGIQIQDIKYREGGQNQVVHRIPGRVEYSDITLRYGVTNSKELWQWFTSIVEGNVERKNVTIVLMASNGTTAVARWDLIDCWPREWRGAPLDALGQEVAIESVTLVFETLKRG
jgi:phage tail-like protein